MNGRRSRRVPLTSSLAGQFAPHERGARGHPRELLVAHVPRRPAEAAVGVDGEVLRRADLEHPADGGRNGLGRVLREALDVHDAGAELAPLAVPLPEIELGQLAARELQHELVGARFQDPREVGLVGPLEARATEPVAEANVEGELHVDPRRGEVEQARHLLPGDVAARRLIDLDEVGARGHETVELLIDDLGEALGHVHDTRVDLARMDPRAERQRAPARRLGVPRRVPLEVLEVAHHPEPGAARAGGGGGCSVRDGWRLGSGRRGSLRRGPARPVALGACPVPDAWRLRSAWRVSFHSSWRAPDYPQNGRVAPGVVARAREDDLAALDDGEAGAVTRPAAGVRTRRSDRTARARW